MKRFCSEWIKDENGRQAAIRAGYSKKAASQQARQLLQDERIQDLIAKRPGYAVPIDDMTLEGHLRALSRLRGKLDDARDDGGLTAPQVSALRGAVDAEIARGKALGFDKPPRDPAAPPMEPKPRPTMSEVMHGVVGNGSHEHAEPQTNGAGEHAGSSSVKGQHTPS